MGEAKLSDIIQADQIPFIATCEDWIDKYGVGYFKVSEVKPLGLHDPDCKEKAYEISFEGDGFRDPILLDIIFACLELVKMWFDDAGFHHDVMKCSIDDYEKGYDFYVTSRKLNDIERARMKRNRGF